MKKKVFLLCLSTLLIFISSVIYSQTLFEVEVSNNVFTPANLTIDVGDTVRWTNTGGFHNVVADDGSFTSGSPSSDPWVYEFTFTAPGVNPYYCVVHGGPGGTGMSGVITVQAANGVSDNTIMLNEFELKQNYPNPFNPTTNIQYRIEESGVIKLAIYNVIGKEVAILVNGFAVAGSHTITFDATSLPSGIYFYKLLSKNFTKTKKMILMK